MVQTTMQLMSVDYVLMKILLQLEDRRLNWHPPWHLHHKLKVFGLCIEDTSCLYGTNRMMQIMSVDYVLMMKMSLI